jgi:hypothetical protein
MAQNANHLQWRRDYWNQTPIWVYMSCIEYIESIQWFSSTANLRTAFAAIVAMFGEYCSWEKFGRTAYLAARCSAGKLGLSSMSISNMEREFKGAHNRQTIEPHRERDSEDTVQSEI